MSKSDSVELSDFESDGMEFEEDINVNIMQNVQNNEINQNQQQQIQQVIPENVPQQNNNNDNFNNRNNSLPVNLEQQVSYLLQKIQYMFENPEENISDEEIQLMNTQINPYEKMLIDKILVKYKKRNKKQLYKCLDEAGFYLPSYNSKACKTNYLNDVINGNCFVIKKEKLSIFYGRTKHTTQFLLFVLKKKCENAKFDIKMTYRYMPDRRWVLNMLQTVFPNCPYLQTGVRLNPTGLYILERLAKLRVVNQPRSYSQIHKQFLIQQLDDQIQEIMQRKSDIYQGKLV